MDHVRVVLPLLRNNTLYVKASKCYFGVNQVEYLGHFILGEGVSIDPRKIEVVVNWPKPSSIKEVKGFLGLASYYRRFMKDFGTIAQVLTSLLKGNGKFQWNEKADQAFQ